MDNTGQNLTKNQLKAIPLILEAKSITTGVKRAVISKTTFYEWLKNPDFKAEFVRQRQEVIDLALHELKTSASEAVGVLRGLLKAEGEGIRLRTALGILDHIGKFMELEKLQERIAELEKRVSGDDHTEAELEEIDKMIADAERRVAESSNRDESKTSGVKLRFKAE